MGQLLLPENIPSIVRTGGTTLTLAATNYGQETRINIGGQQYTVPTLITLNTATSGAANGLDTGALGAIQLWYVYAIAHQTTFVAALVASTALPGTGPLMPSGYGTAYKLVGAFYTDGTSAVGSTVNITGPAITEWMTYAPVISNLGTGATSVNTAKWRRNGDAVQVYFKWTKDGSGGSGAAFVSTAMPAGLAYDQTKMYNANPGDNRFGNLLQLTGGVFNNKWSCQVRNTTSTNGVVFTNDATSDNLAGSGVAANSNWYGDFTLPVTGWLNSIT